MTASVLNREVLGFSSACPGVSPPARKCSPLIPDENSERREFCACPKVHLLLFFQGALSLEGEKEGSGAGNGELWLQVTQDHVPSYKRKKTPLFPGSVFVA